MNATLAAVVRQIEDSDFYPSFLKALQVLIENSETCDSEIEFKHQLRKALLTSGLQRQLSNIVYHMIQRNPHLRTPWRSLGNYKEPLDYIRKAQNYWEKRICKSLNSICIELGIAMARKRPVSDQKEMEACWHELSTQEPDLSQFRPVYAAKDFLDVLISLKSPNYQGTNDKRFGKTWGTIQVPLYVKNLKELQQFYPELVSGVGHLGVMDNSPSSETLKSQREELGKQDVHLKNRVPNSGLTLCWGSMASPAKHGKIAERIRCWAEKQSIQGSSLREGALKKDSRLSMDVLLKNYSLLAREFAKRGCPQNLRRAVWSQILGLEITDKEMLYYDQLKCFVFQHDLMIDKLIYKDVKLTASNDDQYFVFEDYLHQVMLLFSRDTSVLSHFQHSAASPPKALLRGKLELEEITLVYPPSGVIPFHGFSMYVAPMCYVFDEPVQLYFVYREMYTRYFFRLHALSSNPQGVLCLSLLFQKLLWAHAEDLCDHFTAYKIDPLRVAFRWLMRAFSGHLATDQVLLLWDTILAYDSLECLAVLAVAIVCFRKRALMQIRTQAEADAILADLSSIKVIPLLRAFLGKGENSPAMDDKIASLSAISFSST